MQVRLNLFQRSSRQANGHATLQRQECRAYPWQEFACIFMQQPVARQRHLVKSQCCRIARLQAHQL
ncbi:hypothetical protein D3C72_2525020 [compost metagenome]